MANDINKVIAIMIEDLFCMAERKIHTVLEDADLTDGFIGGFDAYGILYTKEVHDRVVAEIADRFADLCDDLDYEWTDLEYDNFVTYNQSWMASKHRYADTNLRR